MGAQTEVFDFVPDQHGREMRESVSMEDVSAYYAGGIQSPFNIQQPGSVQVGMARPRGRGRGRRAGGGNLGDRIPSIEQSSDASADSPLTHPEGVAKSGRGRGGPGRVRKPRKSSNVSSSSEQQMGGLQQQQQGVGQQSAHPANFVPGSGEVPGRDGAKFPRILSRSYMTCKLLLFASKSIPTSISSLQPLAKISGCTRWGCCLSRTTMRPTLLRQEC